MKRYKNGFVDDARRIGLVLILMAIFFSIVDSPMMTWLVVRIMFWIGVVLVL